MDRREFIKACTALGIGTALPGLSGVAFGKPQAGQPVLVNLFLRGGADGLHLVAPAEDPAYITARPPALRVEASGGKAGLLLKGTDTGTGAFYLNRDAAPLLDLYQGGALSFVHAVGLADGTRSHFVAQELIEKGVGRVADSSKVRGGWLARSATQAPGGLLYATPALGVNAFNGASAVLTGTRLGDVVNLPGGAATARFLRAACALDAAGPASNGILSTLDVMDRIGPKIRSLPDDTQPENDRGQGPLFDALNAVSELMRMDVGLTMASVDFGGWDTHDAQAGRIDNLVAQLSGALVQFMNNTARQNRPVVVLVMTEFGRRLRANLSSGTDHGHGACWMVLGNGVRGGQVLGNWPGLAADKLDRGVDLAVTTDYRAVCAAVLGRVGLKAGPVFSDWTGSGLNRLFV